MFVGGTGLAWGVDCAQAAHPRAKTHTATIPADATMFRFEKLLIILHLHTRTRNSASLEPLDASIRPLGANGKEHFDKRAPRE